MNICSPLPQSLISFPSQKLITMCEILVCSAARARHTYSYLIAFIDVVRANSYSLTSVLLQVITLSSDPYSYQVSPPPLRKYELQLAKRNP